MWKQGELMLESREALLGESWRPLGRLRGDSSLQAYELSRIDEVLRYKEVCNL